MTKRFPSWSLSAALNSLKEPLFHPRQTQEHRLLKMVFLVALASGNRILDISAMERSFIRYTQHAATIPVKRDFLFKNQTWDRLPSEITFPVLLDDNSLCPLSALRDYIASTADQAHKGHVFIHLARQGYQDLG